MSGNIRIKHSGNIGDIIYSLHAMRQVSRNSGIGVTVCLQTNVKALYADNPFFNHPSGNVQLTAKGAEMLTPLLMSIPFIRSVEIADKFESIDYDFDKMRNIGLKYQGSIQRWYFYAYPELTCDLHEPIHFFGGMQDYKIVMNRSTRYHNPTFDYRVLLPYQKDITFIGLPDEYEAMKRKLPEITYKEVSNFKETAEIIAGADLFIGNQSMSYALAEVMGVRRILEICPHAHNCIPMTPQGYDCINVQNLIQLIHDYFNNNGTRQPGSLKKNN